MRNGNECVAIFGFSHRTMLTTQIVTMVIIALAALVYGLFGVVVGTLVPREREGWITLVFPADMDNTLSSGIDTEQIGKASTDLVVIQLVLNQ